ncbi:alanine racemase [Aeromicrobium sp. NPDC092404]|uniref:alanine racemase n=1 Tax=Aeromicrobium sp. NPDC092404 TaxID=3154976 RepID=UPI003438414E
MTSSKGVADLGADTLRDLDYPALVLHEDALESNLAAMADFCAGAGVLHAPHAKTSLSPQVVERHLRHGAWAMTAATPAQVRGLHRLGVGRILLANVLVDDASIRWVADDLLSRPGEDAGFWCYVDSIAGAEALERGLAGTDRVLDVLLEVGYVGGRTGTRTAEESLRVAQHVASSTHLRLAGVSGFEGLMPTKGHDVPPGIDAYLANLGSTVRLLRDHGLIDESVPPIVTAGGSSYFDLVADALGPRAFDFPVRTVIRSGCYATHDHGTYRRTSPWDGRASGAPRLRPALELLASIWSRPEPTLVIAGFGRRDVPTDDTLPVVLGRYDASRRLAPIDGVTVDRVNDQHAFLTVPADLELSVGDLLGLGLSHPCGAFDRWPSIPLVDADHIVMGNVTTDL